VEEKGKKLVFNKTGSDKPAFPLLSQAHGGYFSNQRLSRALYEQFARPIPWMEKLRNEWEKDPNNPDYTHASNVPLWLSDQAVPHATLNQLTENKDQIPAVPPPAEHWKHILESLEHECE